MSLRFDDLPRLALRRVAALGMLAVLAGCAGSGTQPGSAGPESASASSAAPANDRAVSARRDRTVVGDTGPGNAAADPDATSEIPEAAAAAYGRAVGALDAGNWIEARTALESFVLEYPDYPGPYVNLAIVYRHDGRDDAAEAALTRALEIDPGHPSANNELGILLRERGKFVEAEAAYRRALETDANYALAHYNLAVLLDLYLRRESEALDHYEIYQSLTTESGEQVGFWIVDLRRRLGLPAEARMALEEIE